MTPPDDRPLRDADRASHGSAGVGNARASPDQDPLIDAVARAVAEMPAAHVESLAAALAMAPRFAPGAAGQAQGAVASPAYRRHARVFLDAWAAAPDMPGAALALALRSAVRAREEAQAEQAVEVVWTGPTSHQVPVRRTREVLLELIGLAQSRLTVVSFAAYRVPEILAALGAAADRGVDVRLVLESADASRGRLTHDASTAFHSLGRSVAFYVWPATHRISAEGISGALHAKAVIADTHAAFVTSANLTGHALTANMELGLLVRGGVVPTRLSTHFEELIAQGVLRRVT